MAILVGSVRVVFRRRTRCLTAVAALVCTAAGCGSSGDGPTAKRRPDRFDAPAAFREIRRQVAVGQRPAGSPQLRRLAVRLRAALPRGRFEPVPGQPGLRNVVGTVPGSRPALVIGAHYDTLVKPKGFVGANNGAAGSAIVIQLARELAARRRPPGAPEVRFVLFDGEEPPSGLPEDSPDFAHAGLRGSRAYVARHAGETGAMVLLDYVAGKGLQLPMEASSTRDLWKEVRAAAARAGRLAVFPARTGEAITDDHTPFLEQRIPAVDLIDWSYPGHSLEDGLARLSLDSVDAVGETLTEFIARWRAR